MGCNFFSPLGHNLGYSCRSGLPSRTAWCLVHTRGYTACGVLQLHKKSNCSVDLVIWWLGNLPILCTPTHGEEPLAQRHVLLV
jgi:hypothetical protein